MSYDPYQRQYEEPPREPNPIIGWVIFILIFGVGNYLLYMFTGILFIPIPRR